MDLRLTQLLRGTLDILILQSLRPGPLHGYAIARHIEESTEGLVEIEDGALYQALARGSERGWVESAWGHAENGKRARFYRLTAEGRRQLRADTASWRRYVAAVSAVLQEA